MTMEMLLSDPRRGLLVGMKYFTFIARLCENTAGILLSAWLPELLIVEAKSQDAQAKGLISWQTTLQNEKQRRA